MLTIAKLKAGSVNYYVQTAEVAGAAARDMGRAGGGLGEYYTEHDTRAPVWMGVGDRRALAEVTGLSRYQLAGGDADNADVTRWLDDGETPNGTRGRRFNAKSVHGYDLTFSSPKSVSLLRARGSDVTSKAVLDAHTHAISEALQYLHDHAGYTRIHNDVTERKDLQRLPGLACAAYQHETSRCGDPHLHTHVLLPNRLPAADGRLLSVDGDSLYHEAKAAGVIYQATLRRELCLSLGVEWAPVNPDTGMAEIAGVTKKCITAWSKRRTAMMEWAAGNLHLVDGEATAEQLQFAQKATRPDKPESVPWAQLIAEWAADPRGFTIDRAAQSTARSDRLRDEHQLIDRRHLMDVAGRIDKAAYTRADMTEVVGASLPITVADDDREPRQQIEAAVGQVSMRVTPSRLAHEREGHERFTLDLVLGEEVALLRVADARDRHAAFRVAPLDVAGLSPDQAAAMRGVAASPWLVCPVSAPAGAGKTTSLRALHKSAHRAGRHVVLLAPTGKAADVARKEGAGDDARTVAKAIKSLGDGSLTFDRQTVVVIDEAAMVGTPELRTILEHATRARAKTVLVGDEHQLAPVRARGGMFAQLVEDLPWTQRLSEVWRMKDPEERSASLGLRDGGPGPLRRSVEWYRRNDRLHVGDAVTMADDALAAYRADVAAGKDAMLIADRWAVADALNARIHNDRVAADAPSVQVAREQSVAVGDIIISRQNDPTVTIAAPTPVRNGQRWEVVEVDTARDMIAAIRISDGARAAFSAEYLQQHVTLGYCATVHASQGETVGNEVTAGVAHSIVSENTTRSLAYVAATRATDANTLYIAVATEGEGDHEHTNPADGVHLASRGTPRDAVNALRSIASRNDDRPRTVHQVADEYDPAVLPDRVASLVQARHNAKRDRKVEHAKWLGEETAIRVEHERQVEREAVDAANRIGFHHDLPDEPPLSPEQEATLPPDHAYDDIEPPADGYDVDPSSVGAAPRVPVSIEELRMQLEQAEADYAAMQALVTADDGPAMRAAWPRIIELRALADSPKMRAHVLAVTEVQARWTDDQAAYDQALADVGEARQRLRDLTAALEADPLNIESTRLEVRLLGMRVAYEAPAVRYQQEMADTLAAAGGHIVTSEDADRVMRQAGAVDDDTLNAARQNYVKLRDALSRAELAARTPADEVDEPSRDRGVATVHATVDTPKVGRDGLGIEIDDYF
jgi:conjugative relaxase-like TrwC/TraI family protein